ncbi:MAG: hypothetical protein WD993_03650 [Thermoleophilaceae bacterium]
MARVQSNEGRAQEDWTPARLIPTVGIRGQEEQEKRATSSLLAVMHAVPEFGHAVLGPLGAPKSPPRTYTEVRFKDADGRACIPDGAVVVERGKNRWSCFVEVKTGTAQLDGDQVSRYLDIAREHGFDAVLTISNQITSAAATDSPVAVDKRKLRRVALYHLSWLRIATAAIVQHRFRGVSDPDQAWILGELIAYLDSEPSGASGFDDMGADWVKVRDAARAGTLRPGPEVEAVAERWDQFVEYVGLGLAQELGTDVTIAAPRRQTREERVALLAKAVVESGRLDGGLRVPDAVGPLEIVVDLGRRQVEATVVVAAPKEGRATARLNWILRQLRDAPSDLRLGVSFEGARETTSGSLAEARDDPRLLLSQADPKRCPRTFAITLVRPMGTKRGKARGSFVGDTRQQAFDFYREIVQTLKAWQPRAPRLVPHEVESEDAVHPRTGDARAEPA